MNTDLKENSTEDKWLIHLYDNGPTWVAYERSAHLFSYVMGDFINVYPILHQETGCQIFKAEIPKKDFIRLVPQACISSDDLYHKILDFHISPERFQAWMESEGMKI